MLEELLRRSSVSLVHQLGDRDFAGAVNADEKVKLAFNGLHLSDLLMEEVNRLLLETLTLQPFDFIEESLVAFQIRQAKIRCRCRHRRSAKRSDVEAMAAMRRGIRQAAAECAVETTQPSPLQPRSR